MMFKLKIVSLFCACCIIGYNGFAQSKAHDSLIVKATLLKKKVEQKDDLLLKVVVVNTSGDSVKVYKELVEGYVSDDNMNFNLIMETEEKSKGKYKPYSNRSLYQSVPDNDSIDYIPKVLLAPNDSVVHFYHLDNVYMFEKGNYRVKCMYKNNIRETNRVSSDWYYFTVVKEVFVTKYYD